MKYSSSSLIVFESFMYNSKNSVPQQLLTMDILDYKKAVEKREGYWKQKELLKLKQKLVNEEFSLDSENKN